jgi:hypothetical protein
MEKMMNTVFSYATLVIVAGLAWAGTAQNVDAAFPSGKGSPGLTLKTNGNGQVGTNNFVTLSLNGRNHRVGVLPRGYLGWIRYCYFPQYRCYGFYCATGWYYWYAPLNNYLPIQYMAQYPPTPLAVNGGPLVGTTPGAADPSLPPGATPVPGGGTPPVTGGGTGPGTTGLTK